MTPLQIIILLGIYGHSTSIKHVTPALQNESPIAINSATSALIELGYLHPEDPDDEGPRFHITQKGAAHVDAILALPEPLQRWVSPMEVEL